MEQGAAPAGEPRQLALGRPRWSAERRAGLRHWPVMPGDPGIGPNRKAGHGYGDPYQRLSALRPPPLALRGTEKREGRGPAALKKSSRRAAQHWLVGCHGWF